MQEIRKELTGWIKVRTRAGFAVLAVALAFLAGCATGGPARNAPVEEPPPLPEGPTVTRLQDDREGFVIREVSGMDAASRASFERAVALMGEGNFEQAAALLEEVVEGAPEVTAPYIDLALALERLDRPEEAEQYLQLALRLFPGHPVASNEYGLLLRKAGRFAEARRIYEKALASFPEYLPAHRNLGILCDLYLDDPACAMEQYEIFNAAMPEDEQVAIWIADLRLRVVAP